MYFDFDFNRDSLFFESSKTMMYMKEQLNENEKLKHIDSHILHVSVQLWGESVIKHNLDINMTRVDHTHLISDQNSKEVLDTIGAIIFKSDKSDQEIKNLRMQEIVATYLDIIILSMEEDICSNLKKEFVEFTLAQTCLTQPKI